MPNNFSEMTTVDIYDDLEEYDEQVKNEELLSQLNQAQETIKQLRQELHEKDAKISELEKENSTLKSNMTNLYVTAKREINRNRKRAKELRNLNNDLVFKRNSSLCSTDSISNNNFNSNTVQFLNVNNENNKPSGFNCEENLVPAVVMNNSSVKVNETKPINVRQENFDWKSMTMKKEFDHTKEVNDNFKINNRVKSPFRRSRSPISRRSNRSPFSRRSKSPFSRRSKSPFSRRSKSPFSRCSKSPLSGHSKSPFSRRSRSPYSHQKRLSYRINNYPRRNQDFYIRQRNELKHKGNHNNDNRRTDNHNNKNREKNHLKNRSPETSNRPKSSKSTECKNMKPASPKPEKSKSNHSKPKETSKSQSKTNRTPKSYPIEETGTISSDVDALLKKKEMLEQMLKMEDDTSEKKDENGLKKLRINLTTNTCTEISQREEKQKDISNIDCNLKLPLETSPVPDVQTSNQVKNSHSVYRKEVINENKIRFVAKRVRNSKH